MTQAEEVKIFRAMDEQDAIKPAADLLTAIAKEEHTRRDGRPGLEITHCPTVKQTLDFKCDNFPQGMYLWRDNKLIALFTVVRDSINYSICVFNDLRKYDEK
jgi:hypothetical protein